jgi:AraC-like DNA-binding protein
MAVGDIAFIDSARPLTFHNDGHEQWLSLQLPRRPLISYLGFEPHGGLRGHSGTRAGRMLSKFVLDTGDDEEAMSASAENYMQLAVYDLLGALFAPLNPPRAYSHTEKLFKHACNTIRTHFVDPDFGPREVAAEVGISLRYLQTLFTARGSTCSRFIMSLRLDHAARRIEHRTSIDSGEPLSTIAYACGFRDYTNFYRAFRRRFGHTPGAPRTHM